jgi:tetratricopeptide (TPR) repeat protein
MNEVPLRRVRHRLAPAVLAAILAAGAAAAQESGAAGGLGAEPTLGQLRGARDALIVAADFAAALDPAERVVSRLEEQGQADADASEDLMRLARIQAELGEFEAAELNYTKVIELLSERDGEFSPSLIEPHQALGRTYIAARRFAEALAVLEQAQHVSQRNEGLFNVDQTQLIDDITLAHLGIGDTVEARNLQIRRLDNAIRRFGEDDVRVMPFHTALGEYYARSRLKVSAREHFEKALAIGTSELGESDPSVLEALRQVAAIDLALGHESASRDRLERVLAENPDIEPREAGLSLAVLGDWAIADGDVELARTLYARAYRSIAASGAGAAGAVFAAPRMLDFVPPISSVDRAARSRPWSWGTVELGFDVGTDGRPRNVETLAITPPDDVGSEYNRRLRETHFRPRLVDGAPVATSNVRFTHNFRYYVNE